MKFKTEFYGDDTLLVRRFFNNKKESEYFIKLAMDEMKKDDERRYGNGEKYTIKYSYSIEEVSDEEAEKIKAIKKR